MSLIARHKQNTEETPDVTAPIPMPGFVPDYTAIEQASFPHPATVPANMPASTAPFNPMLTGPLMSGGTTATQEVSEQRTGDIPVTPRPQTGTLIDPSSNQAYTGATTSSAAHYLPSATALAVPDRNRQLMDPQIAGTMSARPAQGRATAAERAPVVIRGTGRKSTGMLLPPKPKGKRPFVHAAVGALLVLILVGALMAVVPVGANGQTGLGLFQSSASMIKSNNSNTGLIAAQAATATAVTQDGYDQGAATYAGVASGPTYSSAGTSSGSTSAADYGGASRFFYGQCTYWANLHYHALTGHWVPWLGNANQWAYGAAANNWVVSNTPNPHGPSIIVLQAYTQGAGGYGHVAVVDGPASAGSVVTSNWNWGGLWATTTYVTFVSPAYGTKFVWYPGN